MFRKFKPFFIIAETPLHPGSGGELGIVDLPIQRERHTNFPKIEGSGIKGCIREAFENSDREVKNVKVNDKDLISLIFGPEEGEAHAGAIAFTDARILLFPVKSLKGVFAWITCPQVIERFKEDMRIAGENLEDFTATVRENTTPPNSNIIISSKIVLEEFTFEVQPDVNTQTLAKWLAERIFPKKDSNDVYSYWREKLKRDLVVLSNEDFEEFVTNSTEVITRTKIGETGTVEPGALWTEEYLPQDTILYSIAMASPVRVKDNNKKKIFNVGSPEKEAEMVIQFFTKGIPEIIQIGGNQTIGKGIVRIQFFNSK